jgi:hypothetical protein
VDSLTLYAYSMAIWDFLGRNEQDSPPGDV